MYLSFCVMLGIIRLPFKLTAPPKFTIERREVLKLGKIEKEPPPEWMAVKALGDVLKIDSPQQFLNSLDDPVLRERIKFLLLGLIRKGEDGKAEIERSEALRELKRAFGIIEGIPIAVETSVHIPLSSLSKWLSRAGGFIQGGLLYLEPSRFVSILGFLHTPQGKFYPVFEYTDEMVILKLKKE